jgi:hypothetical protein
MVCERKNMCGPCRLLCGSNDLDEHVRLARRFWRLDLALGGIYGLAVFNLIKNKVAPGWFVAVPAVLAIAYIADGFALRYVTDRIYTISPAYLNAMNALNVLTLLIQIGYSVGKAVLVDDGEGNASNTKALPANEIAIMNALMITLLVLVLLYKALKVYLVAAMTARVMKERTGSSMKNGLSANAPIDVTKNCKLVESHGDSYSAL